MSQKGWSQQNICNMNAGEHKPWIERDASPHSLWCLFRNDLFWGGYWQLPSVGRSRWLLLHTGLIEGHRPWSSSAGEGQSLLTLTAHQQEKREDLAHTQNVYSLLLSPCSADHVCHDPQCGEKCSEWSSFLPPWPSSLLLDREALPEIPAPSWDSTGPLWAVWNCILCWYTCITQEDKYGYVSLHYPGYFGYREGQKASTIISFQYMQVPRPTLAAGWLCALQLWKPGSVRAGGTPAAPVTHGCHELFLEQETRPAFFIQKASKKQRAWPPSFWGVLLNNKKQQEKGTNILFIFKKK